MGLLGSDRIHMIAIHFAALNRSTVTGSKYLHPQAPRHGWVCDRKAGSGRWPEPLYKYFQPGHLDYIVDIDAAADMLKSLTMSVAHLPRVTRLEVHRAILSLSWSIPRAASYQLARTSHLKDQKVIATVRY